MPIRDSVTLDEVVEFLNSLLEVDREAISELFQTRVPCNKKMADHETVQVAAKQRGEFWHYRVGLVGIINGIFGADQHGWGHFSIVVDEEKAGQTVTNIIRFEAMDDGRVEKIIEANKKLEDAGLLDKK